MGVLLQIEDLSYRFGIGVSTTSDTFLRWIDEMYVHLSS